MIDIYVEDQINECFSKYIDLIDSNNWDTFDSKLSQYSLKTQSIIYDMIQSCDIHPIDYLSYVPLGYFYQTCQEKCVIPNHISEICMFAFGGDTLKELHIPSSVKSIAASAFKDCRYLKDIYFDGESQELMLIKSKHDTWEEPFKYADAPITIHCLDKDLIVKPHHLDFSWDSDLDLPF